jgi:hypothetical protein
LTWWDVPRPTLHRAKAFPGWPRTWPLVDGKVAQKCLPTYLMFTSVDCAVEQALSSAQQTTVSILPARLPDARPKWCEFRDRCLSAAFGNRDAHFLAPSTKWESIPSPLLFLPGISHPLAFLRRSSSSFSASLVLIDGSALPLVPVLTPSTKSSAKHPHWSTRQHRLILASSVFMMSFAIAIETENSKERASPYELDFWRGTAG